MERKTRSITFAIIVVFIILFTAIIVDGILTIGRGSSIAVVTSTGIVVGMFVLLISTIVITRS